MAVSETRVLPPEFIEAAGKTYLQDLSTSKKKRHVFWAVKNLFWP